MHTYGREKRGKERAFGLVGLINSFISLRKKKTKQKITFVISEGLGSLSSSLIDCISSSSIDPSASMFPQNFSIVTTSF